MSLFTDLRDVLTPYAQRIKGLAADNEQIRADLNTGLNALDSKVDANDEQIKADLGAQTGIISLLKDFYIKTSTTPINLTPIASTAGRMCAVVDCVAGDKFVINAYSNSAQARAWCFIDSTNTALSMADELVTITDTEITAPANASKLIINDMNGGMSYKVGNNLASKMGSGLSDNAKAALLECIRHIARWDDANGQAHYADLYEALYGVPLVTLVFRYAPADGLLSAKTGVTSIIMTETTENIVNGKLRLFAERAASSAGAVYARFKFGEYNGIYGRLKLRAKLSATKYATTDMLSDVSGALRAEVSNATQGAQFFVYRKSNGKIIVRYVVESQSTVVDTDFDANDYHTFEFVADGNTQKLIINGTTVVNAAGLSTSYVGGVRVWCMGGVIDQNITLDIESIEYYEEA